MSTTVIHLAIPRNEHLTSNQRLHHQAKARRIKALRERALVTCRRFRYETLPACTVEVLVTYPDRRVRDAANLEPTSKACIDGMVDAGLLLRDDNSYLQATTYRASEQVVKVPGVAFHLQYTFTPVTP